MKSSLPGPSSWELGIGLFTHPFKTALDYGNLQHLKSKISWGHCTVVSLLTMVSKESKI